jgi:hypothetical protein
MSASGLFFTRIGMTLLYRKTKPVVLVQWVNFNYMRKKKGASFNRIIEACDYHGITDLL